MKAQRVLLVGKRREGEGKRFRRQNSHKYRSNYASANWKLNTLGVDGLRYSGVVVAGCFTGKKVGWEGVGKFTSTLDEGLAVGENDSEKLGSMRKESVKLLELFSKN